MTFITDNWPLIGFLTVIAVAAFFKWRHSRKVPNRWKWRMIMDGPASPIRCARLDRAPTQDDVNWIEHEALDAIARLYAKYHRKPSTLYGITVVEVPDGSLTGTSGSAYDPKRDRIEIETRRWRGPEGLEHEFVRAIARRLGIPDAGDRYFDG